MCSYTYSWYYCNHDYYIWCVQHSLFFPIAQLLTRAQGQLN
jgi:hypothetical protein